MKTKQNTIDSKQDRLFKLSRILALAAGFVLPVTTGLAQTLWITNTQDYNNPANWNGTFNGGSNPNTSNDNGSNNVVLIQPGDPTWQHGDTLAGNGAGTSGAYLQTGSTNNTGGGNWLRMGIGSGSYGFYVLSNGVVNVGGRTQIGENGVGYVEIDGGIYNGNVNDGGANPAMVCGQGDFGPGTGTLVINGGTVTYGRETWFGQQGGSTGTGYFFMNGGTLNVNDWFVFGRNGGAAGAHGYGVMSNGIINFHGGGQFLIGGGGVGSLAQSGGTINAFNQYLIPQSDGGSGGSGTNNLSGNAVLNAHGWLAVGRNGGYGELNISGSASINRDNSTDGGSHFDIGASGLGVVNQNGGTITETGGDVYLGESGTGTWNLESGSAFLLNLVMCVNGNATATLNLDGGLLRANAISSSSIGISTLNLNGGTLQAAADNPNFISGITFVQAAAGGAVFDSQGFNVSTQVPLVNNGGGLTKKGSGSLALLGANSYSGATAVNAGTLSIGTSSSGSGACTVTDQATLNPVVQSANAQFSVPSLTLGSSTGAALTFDLGSFGNPSAAPVTISGTLTANGTTTVNLVDGLAQLGQFPLIAYTTRAGSGRFVIGTLPVGVIANILTNGNSIALNITSVNLPRWDGNAGGNWDIGLTTNWINSGTGLPEFYADGTQVLFNDNATGTPTVNLVTTVNPAGVTVNNNALLYTLTGTGKISGSTSFNKNGTGTFTIANTGANNYTGPTVVNGGTLSVTNLANGGSPSAIGASSASPANLVLSGGTLAYSGPTVTINRGYSLQGFNTNSGIDTEGNLTLSGVVTAGTGDGFVKSGPAQLAYTTVGSNRLSAANYMVQAGSLRLDGSAGGQTNTISGTLSIDGSGSAAAATLTNTTVIANVNVGIGDVANTIGTMEVDSGTTLTANSWFLLGDGANATATLTMNGGTLNVPNGRLFLCSAPGTTATFNMNGGTINKTGDYFAIVNGGWNGVGARSGVVNQVNGTINCQSECWVGDGGGPGNGSVGIYNLSGGSLTLNSWFGVGRDGSTGIFHMTGGTLHKGNGGSGDGDMVIGRGGSSGTFTMSAGTLTKDAGNPIIVGQGQGVGEFDISGGTLTSGAEYWLGVDNGTIATNNISGTAEMDIHNWVTVGRSGLGVANMSSGQFNSDTQPFIVGIFGGAQGIWNQSAGSLNVNQDIWIGQGDTNAYGQINLSGGTITNTGWIAVGREGGHGTLRVSGGTMVKAGVGNNISIAHNGGASGDVIISGTGTFLCLSGETWVGENAAPGTWTMNGGTAVLGLVHLAQNADATGVMTLNAGSLTATEISTGNAGALQRQLDFNGGTLVAGTDNANFIHDLSGANVHAGGALINSAGHTVAVNQALLDAGGGGGLTKSGIGTLQLNGANTYTGATLVNGGLLQGTGVIVSPVTVASGASIGAGTSSTGTLAINNTLTFSSGSTAVMKITPTSNDQITGLTGVNYNGAALLVNNISGSSLVAGKVYKLFNASVPGTGNFSSVTVLPSGSGIFNPATGELTIPGFAKVASSGGKLIMTGAAGLPGAAYTLLTRTNLATGIWLTNTTGTLDSSGMFSNAIPINLLEKTRFFEIRTP